MHPAAWDTDRLLQECECRAGRRRGPGGQHRNKVETAMVITHLPTSLSGEASERRSQLQNRKQALFRLRLNLALQIRQPLPAAPSGPSETWRKHCPRGKIAIRVNHEDYPSLLAEALDTVAAYRGMLAASAAWLGCTPSQLTRFLKDLPRAFAVVNGIRQTHGLKPLR